MAGIFDDLLEQRRKDALEKAKNSQKGSFASESTVGAESELPGFGAGRGTGFVLNPSENHLKALRGENDWQRGRVDGAYELEKKRLENAAKEEQKDVMSPTNLYFRSTMTSDNPMLAGAQYYQNWLLQSPEWLKHNQYTAAEQEAKKQEELNNTKEWAKENGKDPLLSAVFGKDTNGVLSPASILSVGTSLASGADYIQKMLEKATVGKTVHGTVGATDLTQAVRGGVSEDMTDTGKFLYNTAMSGVDSLVASLAGGGGAVLLGLGAASNTYNDIKARGGSDEQAFVGGAVAGAFESLFEKISIGQFNALKEMPVDGAKTFLRNVFNSSLVNFSEEAATELANIVYDYIAMGEMSNYAYAVEDYTKQYMEQGMSEEEARKKAATTAAWAMAGQVGLAGLSGALMGTGFAAIGAGTSKVNAALTGKAYDTAGVQYQLVESALEKDHSTKTYQLAKNIEEKLEKGERVSYGEYGLLQQTMNFEAENAAEKAAKEERKNKIKTTVADVFKPANAKAKAEVKTVDTSVVDVATPTTEVQKVEAVQEANPDVTIVPDSVTLFQENGDDSATAVRKADILTKLMSGDTTLSNTQLRNLDLNSASTRAVIKAVTGMEVPNTNATKTLLAFAKSIAEQSARSNEMQAAVQEKIDAVASMAAERAQRAEAAAAETPVAEAPVQPVTEAPVQPVTEEPVQSTAPVQTAQASNEVEEQASVTLSDGTTVTKAEFIEKYKAANPGKNAEAKYADAVRSNTLGMAYPASTLQKPKAAKSEVKRSVKPAETTAETKSSESETKATKEQEWTINRINRVLSGIKGSPTVRLGFDMYDNTPGHYDEETHTIYLNGNTLNTRDMLIYTLGHEMVHSVNGGQRDTMVDDILAFVYGEKTSGAKNLQAEIDSTRQTYIDFYVKQLGYSTAVAESNVDLKFVREEVAANSMSKLFSNSGDLERLANENKPLLDKAIDLAEKFVRGLAGDNRAEVKALRNEAEFLVDRMYRAQGRTNNTESNHEKDTAPITSSTTEADVEKPAKNTKKSTKKKRRHSVVNPGYAPTFYSHMERVVEGLKQEKFGASTVIPTLKNKGVRAEEIKWTGLDKFLSDKKSVTKQELLDYMRENAFVLSDGELSVRDMKTPEQRRRIADLDGESERLREELNSLWNARFGYDAPPSLFLASQPAEILPDYIDTDDAIFADSIRILEAFNDVVEERTSIYRDIPEQPDEERPRWKDYSFAGGENYREYVFRVPGSSYTNEAMGRHWGDTTGVLAHARVQDFTVDGEKVMLIEEIQSDWHNAGQKDGYGEAVPDAPYSKTYQEYVLKDLIRKAAEGGYSYIAWPTAEQQLDRWNPNRLTNAELNIPSRKPNDVAFSEKYRIEYDQSIPAFLADYAKKNKWDNDIGFIGLGVSDYDSEDSPVVHYMSITDAMKNAVLFEGQPRYSVDSSKPFESQIDSAINDPLEENSHRAVYIKETPNLLAEIGLGDLPMAITARHIRNITHDTDPRRKEWHGVPESVVKLLPELLSNPVAILDSQTQDGQIVVVTSAFDKQGRPVILSIKPNGSAWVDGEEGPANFITSMYGRNSFFSWLDWQAKDGRVLYWNEKRSRDLFRMLQDGSSKLETTTTSDNLMQILRPNRKDVTPVSPTQSASGKLPPNLETVPSDTIIREYNGYVKENIPRRRFSVDKENKTKTGGNTGNVNPDTGYERGSVADSFMRIWNTGDREAALNLIEQTVSRLTEIEAEQAEKRRTETLSNTFRPAGRLPEDTIAKNKAVIEELIAKYGLMPQTSAAQKEVRLPQKRDDKTRVRGFVQTAAAVNETSEAMLNEFERAIVNGDAGATYVPIGDQATMKRVTEEIEKVGFEKALTNWEHLFESGKAISKDEIAMAEQLYIEACNSNDIPTATKLANQIAVAGTQAGQTVQALTLLKKMTPAGNLYYIQKAVDRLNKEQTGKHKDIVINEELAKKLLEADTQKEIQDALDAICQDLANQMPVTLADKWNTWRYLAMLGNPRTHIRNLVGNAVFMPARMAKDMLGATMELALPQEQRTKAFTVSEELRNFAKQDADSMKDVLTGGGKYNPADMIRDKRRIFKSGALNWAEQFNAAWLEKEDWLFLKDAYSRALGGFLSARGVDVSTVSGANSTREGRAILEEARAYAVKEAQKATYRDMSKLASGLNHLKKNHGPAAEILVDGIFPFTKTPINIVKRGVEYSPAGLVKGLVDLRKSVKNGVSAAEAIDELCAGLTGTAIIGLGAMLTHLGVLVGGHDDDDEDNFEELQGVQEYSLRIGDATFTVDWTAPVALPLFVGSEIYSVLAEGVDDSSDVMDAIMDGLTTMLEPMLSLSMLDGLNKALSSNKYGEDDDAVYNLLATAASSYFTQGVPTLFGQIARTIDDSRRVSFTQKGAGKIDSWLSRAFQTNVAGKIPVLSEGRMLYIDSWGRADTESSFWARAVENFILPGYVDQVNTTALESELQRLADAVNDTKVFPDRAKKYFSIGGKDYAMTQEEYEAHLIDRGQRSYKLVSDITNDVMYNSFDDKTRAEAITIAYDYAASVAKLNTNADYDADKWVKELYELEKNGYDVASYLMLRAESKVNETSVTESALGSKYLSVQELLDIVVIDTTMPDSFTDPYTSKHEYIMTAEQQEQYKKFYRNFLAEEYAYLLEDDAYQSASVSEKYDLLKKIKEEVGVMTRKEMSDWLWDLGIEPTPKG